MIWRPKSPVWSGRFQDDCKKSPSPLEYNGWLQCIYRGSVIGLGAKAGWEKSSNLNNLVLDATRGIPRLRYKVNYHWLSVEKWVPIFIELAVTADKRRRGLLRGLVRCQSPTLR